MNRSAFQTPAAVVRVLLALALLSTVGTTCFADDLAPPELPDLPASDHETPAFEVDREQVAFSYSGKAANWNAVVDDYLRPDASLTLTCGMLVGERLGIGAHVNVQSGYAERLASGVLSLSRRLRLQFTAGGLDELRGGCTSEEECGASPRSQNSYLLALKKYFGDSSPVSAISVVAYHVMDGARRDAGQSGTEQADAPAASEGSSARMRGYALNLALRPSMQSRLELRYGRGGAVFASGDGSRNRQDLEFGGLGYTRQFDNCLQLQGRYRRAAVFERFQLGVARDRWSLSLSRSEEFGERGVALQLSYAIPLGAARAQARDCGMDANPAPRFSSLTEAASRRPAQLPSTPLTATDSTELVERVAGW